MNVPTSSMSKGETLIDTAMTLNAMRPDIIVVRHHAAGAVELIPFGLKWNEHLLLRRRELRPRRLDRFLSVSLVFRGGG